MSIFKNLFKKLFGHKEDTNDFTGNSNDDYLVAYRSDNPQKLEPQLKEWVITSIQKNGPINFSWEAGSDESFITFEEERESPERMFRLEDYLTKRIDIPSAGEFEMTGSGTVYIDGNWLKVKYRSSMREILDYNEETDEVVVSEEEIDGGDINLFSI